MLLISYLNCQALKIVFRLFYTVPTHEIQSLHIKNHDSEGTFIWVTVYKFDPHRLKCFDFLAFHGQKLPKPNLIYRVQIFTFVF